MTTARLARPSLRLPAFLFGLCLLLLATFARSAPAEADAVPMVIGNRTIHVFRAPLGAFTSAERAEGARQRILQAFEAPGAGWTSVKPHEQGMLVELDGKPMFTVVPGDVRKLGDESVEGLANAASHVLQTAWSEARERRDPQATLAALGRVALALLAMVVAIAAIWKISRRLREAVTARLSAGVGAIPDAALASRISPILLGLASRACVLFAWVLSLLAAFMFLAFSLDQFAHTRAIGEGLLHAFGNLLVETLTSLAAMIPGMFVALVIFLAAWVCTQISSEMFKHVATGRMRLGMLDAHTAPVTRHIVNATLWLFALAMAYPYLPGAQTEAFKGLSVMLGLMVSIGASGVVGQIASGAILVYTRALLVGEYVRIQDCQGTVTEITLFVTRIRTGTGAEIALPNSLVLSNVTWNFSRTTAGPGIMLDASVTIGYDTPWRQVHALLIDAARSLPEIVADPAPFVVQTGLDDFYVAYRIVACTNATAPDARAKVLSDLHAAIQDLFNRYGVQIMSPQYYEDPATPKVVPESKWYAAPAAAPAKD